MSQSIVESYFIGLDIETTGLSPQHNAIIEVAATVQDWTGKEIEHYESLIKPNQPISDKITEITGITEEMVAHAPTVDQVLPELFARLKKGVIVAHNAPFDLGFLSVAAKEHWLALPGTPMIDTLTMGRAILPGRRKYGLQILAEELDLPQDAAHRALSDARLCMRLFSHLLKVIEESDPIFFPQMSIEELVTKSKTTTNWENLRRIYGV